MKVKPKKELPSHVFIGIDPGTTKSAYVYVDAITKKVVDLGILENESLLEKIRYGIQQFQGVVVAIEMIQGYGTPIGNDVIKTILFIGRLYQEFMRFNINPTLIPRKSIVTFHADTPKANDAIVSAKLREKYAKFPDDNHGKGSTKKPDYFYGFKADIWQAFAVIAMVMENPKEASEKQTIL